MTLSEFLEQLEVVISSGVDIDQVKVEVVIGEGDQHGTRTRRAEVWRIDRLDDRLLLTIK